MSTQALVPGAAAAAAHGTSAFSAGFGSALGLGFGVLDVGAELLLAGAELDDAGAELADVGAAELVSGAFAAAGETSAAEAPVDPPPEHAASPNASAAAATAARSLFTIEYPRSEFGSHSVGPDHPIDDRSHLRVAFCFVTIRRLHPRVENEFHPVHSRTPTESGLFPAKLEARREPPAPAAGRVKPTASKGNIVDSGLTIVLYVAIAALVFYRVIYRGLRGTLITPKQLLVMPVLMIVIGVYTGHSALQGITPTEIAVLGADIVILALMGVLRSATTTLTAREGTTFSKGSPLTIVLWVATIGIRVAFSIFSGAFGLSNTVTSATILMTLGVSIGAQNAFTYYRIQRLGLPLTDQPRTRVSAGR